MLPVLIMTSFLFRIPDTGHQFREIDRFLQGRGSINRNKQGYVWLVNLKKLFPNLLPNPGIGLADRMVWLGHYITPLLLAQLSPSA